MARFLPRINKLYSQTLIKQIILWGLLLFYSMCIVSFYGLKIVRSHEGFDVSDATTGNLIVLDTQYATTMPTTKLDDIYSYTAEPVAIAPALSSNNYKGSPGFIGGGTLSPSSVAVPPSTTPSPPSTTPSPPSTTPSPPSSK